MSPLRLTIKAPGGEVFDATDLLDIDNIGNVNETPEADLGVLTHGDIALLIDDIDGTFEAFVENAAVSDVYEVVLERQRLDGPEWEIVFGGVLDLPTSLVFDDIERTARVTAYSYSKKLERIPASVIARTVGFKTASINADTSQMNFLPGETDDIQVGDVIRLNNGQRKEEFTIIRIVDNKTAIVKAPAGNTFLSVFAEIITPYHRDFAPNKLLQLIAEQCGLSYDVDPRMTLADFPVATPYKIGGGVMARSPVSLVPATISTVSSVVATYKLADGGPNRKTSQGPIYYWEAGTASNNFQFDWTPYLTSEPGTIYDAAPGAVPPVQADTNAQYIGSLGGGGYYVSQVVTYTNGVSGSTAGDKFQLLADNHLTLGSWYSRLSLYKNGVSVKVIEDIVNSGGGASGQFHTFNGWLEWDTVNNILWISYQVVYYSLLSPSIRKLLWWRAVDSTLVTIDAAASGQLRMSRDMGSTGYMAFFDCAIRTDNGPVANGTLKLFHCPQVPSVSTTPKYTKALAYDYPLLWTLRFWSNRFAYLMQRPDGVYCQVFDVEDDGTSGGERFSPLVDFKVSSLRDSSGFLTPVTWNDGNRMLVGYVGEEMFVVSDRYDGVVRYADFKDSSCAKAISDLAIAISGIAVVDDNKRITITSRRMLGSGDVVADLGVPLASKRRPIAETYRSGVVVDWTDAQGESGREIQGDRGDSARRLSISSDLVTSQGMALACALATLPFVSTVREQRDVTVEDDGTRLHVFDKVTMDGKEWLIYKIETNLDERTHSLTLLEHIP